jgi:hypothetical protein
MKHKLILFVLLFGAVFLSAQTYHTLNIDGNNDFRTTSEKFNTTSGETLPAYVTWDNTYLYFGFSGSTPSGIVTDNDRVYHIYLDTDPQSNPTSGTGTKFGEAWRYIPTLPFSANYHYAFKSKFNEEIKRVFDGSNWTNATFSTNNYKGSGFWELKIKLSDIGNPSKILLVAYVEEDWNEGGSVGYICGGVPSGLFTNNNSQGNITFNNTFLGFELRDGIYPNANYNLNNSTFDKWDVKINASVNSLSDNCYSGMSFYATDGYDTLIDLPKPGNPPSNFISVYFEHNDWSAYLGNYYSKDIKKIESLNANYKTWTFKVNTDKTNETVTLVFSEFADVPSNYEIKLKDLTTNTVQDIRSNQNYTYNSGTKGVRTFELTIGVAPVPNISIDPTSLNFNQVLVGSSSNKDFKITNTGNTTLTVSNVVSSNAKYTFSGGTSYTIAAGAEKTVTVTFSPTAVGTENGNITITSDDPDSPTTNVTLTGEGYQTNPNIVVTPTSLAFGNVTVNTSSNLSLKIKNTGDANLSITNIVSGNSVFTFSGGTTYTIAPNDSVSLTVTFSPTALTTYNSNLTITSNDPNQGTLNVALSGTGTALPPNITVSPSSLNFGNVAVGNTNSLNITVSNDGGAVLNILNIIVNGAIFSYSGNTSFSIAPSASNQLAILFKPTSATSFSGSVKIISNSPGEDTVTVTLTGVGTTSSLTNKFNPGWSLMSIPLAPANPLASNVIGSVIYPYYLYGYNNSGGYIGKDTLSIGSGYWLGIEDTATISLIGLGNTETVNKNLNNGWNLVSSPFIKNISKATVQFTKGNETVSADEAVTRGWIQNSYYEYNSNTSSYSLSDSLKQWKGYWFVSLTDNLIMKFDYPTLTESINLNKPDLEPSVNDWKVNIIAKLDNLEDNILNFGANVNATDGFDSKYDLAKPPVSPANNSVYSYFYNNGSSIITKLANDIKKSFTSPDLGKTWAFEIISTKSGTVELSWNNILNELPTPIKENYQFKLTGYGITNYLNMLSNKSYQFNAEANVPYSFVINGIITGVDNESSLNYDYKLMQNYPNPFNPSTIISFTLPQATFVTLKVYDMLGSEVATLVNSEIQSGYYQINFNANGLSSGVYFYTIKAGNFTDTKKLILAK